MEIIDYFEKMGAIQSQPEDNPAEYILQVIGAGATAKVDRDWPMFGSRVMRVKQQFKKHLR